MLLPFFITPLYAALCAILLVFLSVRVIRLRRRLHVGLGDGGQPLLLRAIRVHSNFAEYVPLALILLLLLELSHQVPGWALHGLGALLLAGRLIHAAGVSRPEGSSLGRVGGMACTLTMLLIAAGWLLVLAARAAA